MSNYINNLIAKSQNAAEVVRPRLPSIYEPPSLAARTVLGDPQSAASAATPVGDGEARGHFSVFGRPAEPNAATAERDRQPPRIAAPATPTPGNESAGSEATAPARRGLQRLPAISERASEAGPAASSRPVTQALRPPAPRLSEAGGDDQQVGPTGRSTFDEPPDETPRSIVKPARDVLFSRRPLVPVKAETPFVEARERAGPQDDESTAAPQTAVASPDRGQVFAPSMTGAPRAASTAADTMAARIVVHPRVARRDEQAPTHESGARRGPRFQAEAPPAPTINVTIGRIEVKALPPAASRPRQQQTAAAPLLSLDEYLRKRDAGGDSV